MDNFFTQKHCDRCGKNLTVRTMSILNTDVLCMECKEEETKHPAYKKACEAELEEVRNGNYNYRGLLNI